MNVRLITRDLHSFWPPLRPHRRLLPHRLLLPLLVAHPLLALLQPLPAAPLALLHPLLALLQPPLIVLPPDHPPFFTGVEI
jgi:hypothetical protein